MTGLPRHTVGVAAVVTDERGRILVVRRRDNGRWEIPGGALELDESVHDGLCREVEEETGLRVEALGLTGVYKNVKLGVVALIFRARVTGGAMRTSEESSAVTWFDMDEVERAFAEPYAVRVRDALAGSGPPVVRTHDGVRLLDEPAPDR